MGNTSRPGENSANDKARLRAGLAGVVEQKALIARAQAQLIRHHAALAEVALEQIGRMGSQSSRARQMPMRSLAAGVAFSTHVHYLPAQKEITDAFALVTRFPAPVASLTASRAKHSRAEHTVS